MSEQESRAGGQPNPEDETPEPGKTDDASTGLSPTLPESYRKYREAELDEERRLERYERTKSINTEHPRDSDGGE